MSEKCSEEYYVVKKKLKSLGLSHEMMQVVLPFLRRTRPTDEVHRDLTHQISVLEDQIENLKNTESTTVSILQGKIKDLKEKNKTLRSSTKGQAITERDEAVLALNQAVDERIRADKEASRLRKANEALKEKCESLNERKNKWLEKQGQELGEKHQQELLALKAQHRKQLISVLENLLPDGMTDILHQVVAG